jgi:hypothetical protein
MQRKFLLLLIIFSASALSFTGRTTGEKVEFCHSLSVGKSSDIENGETKIAESNNFWAMRKETE